MRFRAPLHACLGAATLALGFLHASLALADPPPFMMSWGTEGSGPGQMQNPFGVATDPDGNVYVAEWGNHRVQKFAANGIYLGQWGSEGSGVGQFEHPEGITVDNLGRVFVADAGNHRIQVFTTAGVPLFQWGTFGTGPGQFAYPSDVAVNFEGVFVADFGNDRVQKFTADGAYVLQWGSHGSGPAQFDGPVALDTGAPAYVYVADHNNYRVKYFSWTNGAYAGEFGTASAPAGIAGWYVSSPDNVVRHYVPQWYSEFELSAGLNDPRGVAVGKGGAIYVADSQNHRVVVFGDAATPVRSTTWGRVKAAYR